MSAVASPGAPPLPSSSTLTEIDASCERRPVIWPKLAL